MTGTIQPRALAIQAVQEQHLSRQPSSLSVEAVSGGCIHHCFKVTDGGTSWFVKVATEASAEAMLSAEADGLKALAASGEIRVPAVIAQGSAENRASAWLILEHLELRSTHGEARLGQALAHLHQHTHTQFGWSRPNFLGLTPQPNDWNSDIARFMMTQRIGFQLQLAEQDGLDPAIIDLGWRLNQQLPSFYQTYQPRPSLLHGDLWQGNQAQLRDGTPVIFDPAVHYGDPEADLAMSELFGGFSGDFYAAYREHAGIDEGYRQRKLLHQLYHVLNHHHLFGTSYQAQTERLIKRLLQVV